MVGRGARWLGARVWIRRLKPRVAEEKAINGSEPEKMGEMKIDELARRAGTTTRNVRAYQTRGLLPSPRMAGRVGYYDEGHLGRLRYIDRLREKGFSLAAIHDLLKAWEQGRSLSDVLGFEEALMAPWGDEAAESINFDGLKDLFPEIVEKPDLIQRAIELGLLVAEGDEYRVASPRLLDVGATLVSVGVPLSAVLDEHVLLQSDVRRIAERFVGLFDRYEWEPFVEAGLPPDRLPQVTESIIRLRPIALVAVQVLLERAMQTAVAASTARQVQRFFVESEPSEAS